MLNHKKIIDMARKLSQAKPSQGSNSKNGFSSVASKGHIVVYSVDGERFMVPVSYLTSNIFRELFDMAEELLGIPRNGPITLPCDADFLKQVNLTHRRKVSQEEEQNLLDFVSIGRCSASPSMQQGTCQQQLLCSF